MTTLLEKRQKATIATLQKRKSTAEAHIKKHTDALQVKLAPHHAEIEMVDRMLNEYRVLNPDLFADAAPAADADTTEGGTVA